MKIINNCGFAQAIFLTPKKTFSCYKQQENICIFFLSCVFWQCTVVCFGRLKSGTFRLKTPIHKSCKIHISDQFPQGRLETILWRVCGRHFSFFEIIKLKFREISRKLAAVLPCCVLGGKVLFLWWDSMNFFDSCWHPTTFGTRRVHEKMALQSVLSRYAHNTTGIQFY